MLQVTFYHPGRGHFKSAGLITSCSVAGEECVPALYIKCGCQLAITLAFNCTLKNFTVQRPTDELYCRAVTRLQLVIDCWYWNNVEDSCVMQGLCRVMAGYCCNIIDTRSFIRRLTYTLLQYKCGLFFTWSRHIMLLQAKCSSIIAQQC